MAVSGLMLSLVGYSEMFDTFRYTLGSDYLWDGIPLVPFVVGLFAVSGIDQLQRQGWRHGDVGYGCQDQLAWSGVYRDKGCSVPPRPVDESRRDRGGNWDHPWAWGRCRCLHVYFVGMQRTTEPDLYGKGSVEGIIASETANDAKEGGALLPTVAFGIPGSPDMAILLGASSCTGYSRVP